MRAVGVGAPFLDALSPPVAIHLAPLVGFAIAGDEIRRERPVGLPDEVGRIEWVAGRGQRRALPCAGVESDEVEGGSVRRVIGNRQQEIRSVIRSERNRRSDRCAAALGVPHQAIALGGGEVHRTREFLALRVEDGAGFEIRAHVIQVVAARVVMQDAAVALALDRFLDFPNEGDVQHAAIGTDARGLIRAGVRGERRFPRRRVHVNDRGGWRDPCPPAISGHAVRPET